MKLEIELHIPAQIFDFCEYYEQWESGLGDAVEEDIYSAIARIESHPLGYQVIRKEIRRVLLKRFPLAIFYQYFEDTSTVLILDILSQASGKKSRWPE